MNDHQLLSHFRSMCLSLPNASEVETWGHPTFRVGAKIFASASGDPPSVGFKVQKEHQQALIQDARFSVADYVGRHGWVNMALAEPVDWDEVQELVLESYGLIAPRKLADQALAAFDASRRK